MEGFALAFISIKFDMIVSSSMITHVELAVCVYVMNTLIDRSSHQTNCCKTISSNGAPRLSVLSTPENSVM